MDQKLNKLEEKLDKLDERLDVIDKHLAVYNQQLTFHIKRTEILEEELKPIKKHVDKVQAAFWLITSIIGIAEAVHLVLK